MSRTRLAKISPVPRGEWDTNSDYNRLDIVQYQGSSWLAKRDNTGVVPVECDVWMLMTDANPAIEAANKVKSMSFSIEDDGCLYVTMED